VQVATVQRLLDFYNREILPVVYQQGSLGAGDEVPLAHLGLSLLGLGEVNYQGYRLQTADALHLFSWEPLTLTYPEGSALLTGTQFMLAYGVHTLLRAQRLARAADVIGALSYSIFGGSQGPFDARLHQLRPYPGQALVAERLRNLLTGSELLQEPSLAEPSPYSVRCQPQVHGASRDALTYVAQVLETECNAVTSNPIFFPAEETILSSGNFHGQPLALALDFLAMAVAGLGNISERRTAQLPGEKPDLLSLSATAASLVNQTKQLCAPASVDNAFSSHSPEDHVSNGGNAATKARRVLENVEQILAIELRTAVQALRLRRPARTSPALEQVVAAFEQKVNGEDPSRAAYLGLQAAAAFVRTFEWP
jgi:histidine ammonia-lyase